MLLLRFAELREAWDVVREHQRALGTLHNRRHSLAFQWLWGLRVPTEGGDGGGVRFDLGVHCSQVERAWDTLVDDTLAGKLHAEHGILLPDLLCSSLLPTNDGPLKSQSVGAFTDGVVDLVVGVLSRAFGGELGEAAPELDLLRGAWRNAMAAPIGVVRALPSSGGWADDRVARAVRGILDALQVAPARPGRRRPRRCSTARQTCSRSCPARYARCRGFSPHPPAKRRTA